MAFYEIGDLVRTVEDCPISWPGGMFVAPVNTQGIIMPTPSWGVIPPNTAVIEWLDIDLGHPGPYCVTMEMMELVHRKGESS